MAGFYWFWCCLHTDTKIEKRGYERGGGQVKANEGEVAVFVCWGMLTVCLGLVQYERQSMKQEADELMETLDSQWEDVRGLISQPVRMRREGGVEIDIVCVIILESTT